jgi:hypothetical protein
VSTRVHAGVEMPVPVDALRDPCDACTSFPPSMFLDPREGEWAEGEECAEGPDSAADFVELPSELLDGEWTVMAMGEWLRSERIVVLKGRALVHALRHWLRSVHSFGK